MAPPQVPPRAASSSLLSRASLEAWFSSSRTVACLGTTTFLGLRFREPWRLFYSNVKPSDKVCLLDLSALDEKGGHFGCRRDSVS